MKSARYLGGKALELAGAISLLFALEAGILRNRVDQEYKLLGAGILLFVVGWLLEKPARV